MFDFVNERDHGTASSTLAFSNCSGTWICIEDWSEDDGDMDMSHMQQLVINTCNYS